VEVGQRLVQKGHRLAGIRLDSGDLAYLSIEARKILDAGGFPDAAIVGSNDLDEYLITSLKQQSAAINTWGVGTKLVTAYDDPALGGVYKLSALRTPAGSWEPKLKLSEQAAKVTTPGVLQVRRFRGSTEFIGDAIYDSSHPLPESVTIVDPADATRRKRVRWDRTGEDFLLPVVRRGELACGLPPLPEIQARVQQQLALFHPGIKRFENPHRYPAGLELELHELKTRMVLQARGETNPGSTEPKASS
jgi:nicotinate phosphoribosyltransferase